MPSVPLPAHAPMALTTPELHPLASPLTPSGTVEVQVMDKSLAEVKLMDQSLAWYVRLIEL